MKRNRLWEVLRTPIAPSTALMVALIALVYLATCFYIRPVFDVMGDAPSYLEAMKVLNGMEAPEGFIPNRILTTFLSVGSVSALAWLMGGSYMTAWFFLNSMLFFGLGIASYLLFRRVLVSTPAAIVSALFVVANYDAIIFGLNYLTDIGGWFGFVLSLYFLYRYVESKDARYVWWAALTAGVGGLFKEYAFFGLVPLGLYLLYEYRTNLLALIRASVPLWLALVLMLLVHAGVYLTYGYTYLDWYRMNQEIYGFRDWQENAIKSYGVVLSVLAPLAVVGFFYAISELKRAHDWSRAVFIGSLVLPALVVLVWPSITQRLVFMAVPLAALFAGFVVKRHEKYWPLFAVVCGVYFLIALLTDGYILSRYDFL